jgi:hypothetical protein
MWLSDLDAFAAFCEQSALRGTTFATKCDLSIFLLAVKLDSLT